MPKLTLVLLIAMAAGACGPAAAPAGGPNTRASVEQPARTPKRIVWAMDQRVEGFTELFGGPASGWRAPYMALHDFLIVLDDAAEPHPRLATEAPSQAQGTWRVNPDGTMETTWKLRPGATWHNGEPLRPEDFAFGWRVARDPAVPYNKRAVAAAIAGIDVVDATTMVFRWQNLYPFADRIQQFDLDAFPSWNQSLVDSFETNKADFPSQPWLTREFVGLGPYRLTAWDPGVSFLMEPYANWYGGRAKIDRIEVRVVPDDNTRLAGVLAGDSDVTLANAGGPLPEQWDTLIQQYEQPGMGSLIKEQVGRLNYGTPKWSNPLFGGNDKTLVRQAMTMATDREAIAELMVKDRALVSHSWIQQGTPLYQSQSSKIVVYPFDRAAAVQAFQTAGWTPGPDGILRDSNGQRFQFQYMTGGTGVRQAPVIQDDWRKVGVDMEIEISSPQLSANLEYQASFTGIQGTGNAISFAFLDGRFHSRNVARPENRWGGQNRSAYVDPESHSIVERLLTALDQTERWNLEGDLANLITRNAVFFWYYHPTYASTAKKGLVGLKPSRAVGQSGDLMLTWNIADWDVQG